MRHQASRVLRVMVATALVASSVVLNLQVASAAVVAEDAFDYPVGDLDGNAGGAGFTGAWNDSAGFSLGTNEILVVATGLSHPTGGPDTTDAVQLNHSGAGALVADSFYGRTLASPYGTVDETIWVSFLIQPQEMGSDDSYMGLVLGDGDFGNDNQLFVGYLNSDYVLTSWADTGTEIAAPAVSGETAFLVLQLEIIDPGNERATLFVNPNSGEPTPSVSGTTSMLAYDLPNLDTISLAGLAVSDNPSLMGGLRIGSSFADVALTDGNDAPTDIALAPSDVDEEVPVGTTVGTLTSTDANGADTHSYALVAGAGDADNGLFTIVGDELRTNAALDFEALGGTLNIRVETTDSGTGNLTYSEALTVTLSDVNEAGGFTVNSQSDIVDQTIGDGSCDTGNTVGPDPECTLRAAIQEANASAIDDITLPGGTYTLSIGSSGEDAAAAGDLDISSTVTITGAGAGTTIIQAGTTNLNGIDRVFEVLGGGSLDISDVTIRHGQEDDGAGIMSVGDLTIEDAVFTENTGQKVGGAVHVKGSGLTLTIRRVEFISNTGEDGGAVAVKDATATVEDSTFASNTATRRGGGFHNDAATATIDRSTFTGNSTATEDGAGILNRGGAGVVNLTNSTLSGNSAAFNGGGLSNEDTATLLNVTVTDNSATNAGGGIEAQGGTLNVKNTIVAGNTLGGNCSDTVISQGYNLEDTNTCGFNQTGDQVNATASLGPLQDNGGLTTTHGLLSGSDAIDGGTNTGAPAADQRGVARPIDGDGDTTATVDVGAYESAAPTGLPPNAVAGGPYSTIEGEDLILDGSGSSDPDSDPLTYNWDIDNDGQYDDATGPNPTVAWLALVGLGFDDDGGPYPIGLEVDDGNGNTDTATVNWTVANTPPTIEVTSSGSVAAGGLYTVNLSVTDPGDDTVTEWIISWGDGDIETIPGNPATYSHTYALGGFTRNILASVKDEDSPVNKPWHQNEMIVPGLFAAGQLYLLEATTGVALENLADGHGLGTSIAATLGPDGLLFVGDYSGDSIDRYEFNAGSWEYFDEWIGTGGGGLNGPAGMEFGPDGYLYVSSNFSDRIIKYHPVTKAASDFVTFQSDGLDEPDDMTFGPDGNLYVTSFRTDEVLKYDGTTGLPDPSNPFASGIEMDQPSELTFGPDGNLYVTSVGNNTVEQYNGSNGNWIKTFAAPGGTGLTSPRGAVFGPDGHLYVSGANRIIRYDGGTGALIDTYVDTGTIAGPSHSIFVPEHRVDVVVGNNAPTDI